MGFDPYQQWLQIPSGRRPPSYYELLGLSIDETDRQRIDEAASKRIEQVRNRVLGQYGQQAIRIVTELSQALDCLISPEKRTAYDLQRARESVAHWLHFDGEPDDFYELLDRPLFTPRGDDLLAAVEAARQQLNQHDQDGADPQRVARLIQQLDAAETALSDVQAFRQYHRPILARLCDEYVHRHTDGQTRWNLEELETWLRQDQRVHPRQLETVAGGVCAPEDDARDELLGAMYWSQWEARESSAASSPGKEGGEPPALPSTGRKPPELPSAEFPGPGRVRSWIAAIAGRAWRPVAANPVLFAGWTGVAVVAVVALLCARRFAPPPSPDPQQISFGNSGGAEDPQAGRQGMDDAVVGDGPGDLIAQPVPPETTGAQESSGKQPPGPAIRPETERPEQTIPDGSRGVAAQAVLEALREAAVRGLLGNDPRRTVATGATGPGAAEEGAGRSDPEQWRIAEQFARQHAGAILDQVPFTNGRAAISLDLLPGSLKAEQLFLGFGELHLDTGSYPFGTEFSDAAPATGHEISRLATELGLQSVAVRLRDWQTGVYVFVEGTPRVLPPGTVVAMRAAVEELQERAQTIRTQLRIYRSRQATKAEKEGAFVLLAGLLGINLTISPAMPNQWLYRNPIQYQQALSRYHAERAAHQRAIENVIPRATQEVSSLEQQIEQVQKEHRNREVQLRQENQHALAALRRRCREISVIVYPRPEGGRPPPSGRPAK